MNHRTSIVLRGLCAASVLAIAGCNTTAKPGAGSHEAAPAATPLEPTDAASWNAERVYTRWRDRFAEDPNLAQLPGDAWATMDMELKRVANESGPAHLRANAALLLGALYEERGAPKIAIAHYRQASKLVTDDAGPYMALALALAAEKQFAEAARVQKRATELDPDNLENWLALAELLIKSGDKTEGAKAYVDYERRRKGLIDGLTLRRKDGKYLIPPQERAACAEALASANDEGTAVALMYALKSDDDASVRETAARMMGLQRFTLYQKGLEDHLKTETDESVKTAVAWALTEVAREPVAPSTAPVAAPAVPGVARPEPKPSP